MDCSTADMPSNVAHDSPGKGSACSDDDDIPLSKLVTKPRSEEKQSKQKQTEKDKRDDSSDDEPLIKKKISAPAKKPEKKGNASLRSNGTNNKKADVNSDDSADNEPLIKIAKKSPKAAKKPPKKPADSKKKESPDDDDNGSDDEPLSELRKKLYPKRQRKAPVTPSKAVPLIKSKRNAGREKVQYAEPSSDDSDNETLATMKRKITKAPEEQKSSANGNKTKPKDKSLKDSSPDDDDDADDVPLANLVAKKKQPVKKNTKKTTASQGRASRERRGDSDESSEDEPLINLVKKKGTGKPTTKKTKASPRKKKRNTTPKKSRKTLVSVSSSNSSDDEPLVKAAKHPQVTKILNIILERCDGEEAGDAGSRKKPSTETKIDEKNSREQSEESPEEE